MEFVNLTGHSVALLTNEDPIIYEPSGTIIRLRERVIAVDTSNAVKVKTVEYETDGKDSWPQPRPNVLYIVSYMIARAADWREDLVFPFDLVRKPGGVIVGCRSFARIPRHTEASTNSSN